MTFQEVFHQVLIKFLEEKKNQGNSGYKFFLKNNYFKIFQFFLF